MSLEGSRPHGRRPLPPYEIFLPHLQRFTDFLQHSSATFEHQSFELHYTTSDEAREKNKQTSFIFTICKTDHHRHVGTIRAAACEDERGVTRERRGTTTMLHAAAQLMFRLYTISPERPFSRFSVLKSIRIPPLKMSGRA